MSDAFATVIDTHSGYSAAVEVRSMENPRRPLDPWALTMGGDGGDLASSGVRVGREKALTVSGYWRGINLIANTVAKLPLRVYRYSSPGVEVDPKHPAYRLVSTHVNPYMTPFTFKQVMTFHALAHGNGYAYVVRNVGGRAIELLPLDPKRTTPVREGGELWYDYEFKTGTPERYPARDVVHVKGLGYDGLQGYDVLAKMREALGLGLATQGYGGTFFRNSARPSIILQHPSKLSNEAAQRIRQDFERMHTGVDNAHRVAVLSEGLTANPITLNARDSQLIESRQFSLIDYANFLGIPPHKLGAAVNVSYKSLEQENQAFLDDSVDPWLISWEEELCAKLLSDWYRDRGSHTIAFDRFPLVRADLVQRGQYYATALTNGWMSRDEVRAREGLNPAPDGEGGLFTRPLNMKLIGGDPDGVEGGAVAPGSTLLAVPDVRQAKGWDCGVAAVAGVCRFFGVEEGDLVADLGATPAGGTRPAAILSALQRRGLATMSSADLAVVDLARFFAAGMPVLCPVQAGEPGAQTSGHWVTVVGAGLGMVMVMDPAAGPRMIAEADWLARWHDADADGATYERYGIAVGDTLPVGHPAPDEGDDPDPKPAGDARKAIRAVAADTLARMVRRVCLDARRAAGTPGRFLQALDAMHARNAGTVAEALAPLALATGAGDPQQIAAAMVAELRGGLLELSGRVSPAGLRAAVAEWCDAAESNLDGLTSVAQLTGW